MNKAKKKTAKKLAGCYIHSEIKQSNFIIKSQIQEKIKQNKKKSNFQGTLSNNMNKSKKTFFFLNK